MEISGQNDDDILFECNSSLGVSFYLVQKFKINTRWVLGTLCNSKSKNNFTRVY